MTRAAWMLCVLVACAACATGENGSGSVFQAPVAAPGKIDLSPFSRITPAELGERIAENDPDVVVLDVRTAEEFASGHVPGARNVPHDQVKARLAELAPFKDRDIVLYCRSGRRSGLAAEALRDAGFTRLELIEGDFPAWAASALPVGTGTQD